MKFFILFFFLFSLSLHAAYVSGSNANQLAAAIEGDGITITNPVIAEGTNRQRGTFTNGIDDYNLEVDQGIVLTTMTVQESFTTNNSIQRSVNHGTQFADLDLTNIDNRARYNPIIFEFDVTLDERTRLLIIDYQFASEEYPEYVGSQFNDAFGFFISGGDLPQTYNIARVADNQAYIDIDNIGDFSPVAVNNVNIGADGQNADGSPRDYTNAAFFIDNNQNNDGGTSPVRIEYDGLTVRLNATLDKLTPGETYHVKMALADTADSQLNSGVFINQIRGLREPALCYDYAFKQDHGYITNEHNDTTGPRLTNSSVSSSPIEVGLYVKNTEVSEITTSNISLSVLNLDNSQAQYISNSVFVTNPGVSYTVPVLDGHSGMTANATNINNIPIESFDSLEYFYTYFSLLPQETSLDLPFNVNLNYTITIPLSPTESISIPRFTTLDEDIPFCDGTFYDYKPVYGRFNVIQTELPTVNNLLTQVVNRAGQHTIVSLDPDDLVSPNNISTPVAVDLIHLNSFHIAQASCDDTQNSMATRQWFLFDNNSQIDFSFLFPEANENTAFRVSTNLTNNGDNSLVQTEVLGTDNIKINNYTELTYSLGGTCANGNLIFNPESGDTTNSISLNCNGAQTGITKAQLDACMECLYGYNVENICSRDNFAIRPEAFKIEVDDNTQPLTTNYTGVTNPIIQDLELAAGYDYDLSVRAVHYQDISGNGDSATEASTGYKTSNDYTLEWQPLNTQTVTGCNAVADILANLNFTNGVATLPQSFRYSEVGRYHINVLDSQWTRVDGDPAFQPHHINAGFSGTADCILNNANVIAEGSDIRNGCDIDSTHTHPVTNVQYRDIRVSYRPYTFDLTQVQLNIGVNALAYASPGNDYTYNNTLNYPINDFNTSMAVRYSGPIRAIAYDNIVTTNFVEDCYSEALTILVDNTKDINHPLITDPAQDHLYRMRLHNLDNTGTPIAIHESNTVVADNPGNETIQVNLTQDYFQQNQNGVLNPVIAFNYDKNNSIVANPIRLQYPSRYQNVACNSINCRFRALQNPQPMFTDSDNVTPNLTVPNIVMNNVTHYYARSFTPRQSYTAFVGNAPIFYESYCDVNNGCDATLLQGTNVSQGGDTRWRINQNHTNNFGVVQNITQKNAANVTSPAIMLNSATLTYNNNRGRPYTATMQHQADGWLIYNPYNANAITNEFEAEFIGGNSSWAGDTDTVDTTQTNASQRSNRKLVW